MLITFWNTDKPLPRVVMVILASVFPVVVAVSRMYVGMHYLTDVVVGAIFGTPGSRK